MAQSRVIAAASGQRRVLRRSRWILLSLTLLLLVLVADISVGSDGMALRQTLATIVAPGSAARADVTVVWQLRMPMTLCALLVGAALALAGAEMQTLLGNALAEPYTLGVSAAASFGASLNLVFGVSASFLGMAGMAWVFAMASTAVILAVSAARGGRTETMVLLGIAMVFLFSALLQYIASSAQLEQIVFWTLGSLSRADWSQLALLAGLLVAAIPALLCVSWKLTAVKLGEERARALGVPVAGLRLCVLAGVSLVAATAVSMAGSIGFIGLVGPHIARLLVGDSQRHFLPASVLTGAIVLTGSFCIAKLLVPGVLLPVGIVTSIVGVPVFVALILSRRQGT